MTDPYQRVNDESLVELSKFKEEAIQRLNDVMQENGELREKLDAKYEEIHAVALEYQSIKKNYDTLQTSYKKLMAENDDIKYELAMLLRHKSVAEEERDDAKKKYLQSEEKAKKLEDELREATKRYDQKDKGFSSIQQEAMTLAKQVMETKAAKLSDDRENIEEMRKGFHDYLEELKQKEATIMGLRDLNAKQESEILTLKKDVANQNFQHSVLYEKYESMRVNEQKLTVEVDGLRDKLERATADFQYELEECDRRHEDLKQMMREKDYAAVPMAESEEKILLQTQIKGFKIQKDEHVAQIRELREKVSEMRGTIRILYDEYCLVMNKLNAFQPTVTDIKALQLKTIEVMVAAFKTDEAQKKREYNFATDTIGQLERKLKEAEKQIESLKAYKEQQENKAVSPISTPIQPTLQQQANIAPQSTFGQVHYSHSQELYQLRKDNESLRQRLEGPDGEVARLKTRLSEVEKLRDEGLEKIRREIKEFSLNKQQTLEKERMSLLVRCVEAEEQLKELQQYLDSSIPRYQRDIVELRSQLERALAGPSRPPVSDMSTQTIHELNPIPRPSAPLRRAEFDILHIQHQDPHYPPEPMPVHEQYAYNPPMPHYPAIDRRRPPSPNRRIRSAENNHGYYSDPMNPAQVSAWHGYRH